MSAHRVRRILLTGLVAILLVGCGGSGPSLPPVDVTLFTPNYVSSLRALYHWDHLPIKVAFNLPSDWQQRYPANPGLYIDAANEWNQPGRHPMVSLVTPALADVQVFFVSPDEFEGNIRGQTEYTVDSRGVMRSALIKISLDIPGVGSLSASDAQLAIAHEIGHALGIAGHSPNEDDLMHYSHPFGASQVTSVRDLNTAMTAYPSYFSSPAVPMLEAVPQVPETLTRQVIN